MSHFVVMVTNVNEEPLEEQLEPFYEQGEEGDYFMEKEYWLGNDKEEINKWLDNEIEGWKSLLDNPEASENNKKWWEKKIKELQKIKTLKTVKGQLKAIEKDQGCGLDKNGLYWISNPNAKWDWWVEGGRWDNWLITKNGKKCNRCKVKDIDFDKMMEADMKYAEKTWNEEMDRAKENGYAPNLWGFNKFPSRKEYVESFKKPVAPYAVLHEGEWIEKGEMGWWGIDDPHCTEDEWIEKFHKFIKELDPETEVAIVDCHI